MAKKEFTDQNFRQLCNIVKGVYTDPDHVKAVGWDADTPVDHIECAVIAEIHSRMEEFIGERLDVKDRLRAHRRSPESLSESHTRRRREEIIRFTTKHGSTEFSPAGHILNETVQAVIDHWRHKFGLSGS